MKIDRLTQVSAVLGNAGTLAISGMTVMEKAGPFTLLVGTALLTGLALLCGYVAGMRWGSHRSQRQSLGVLAGLGIQVALALNIINSGAVPRAEPFINLQLALQAAVSAAVCAALIHTPERTR